MTECSHSVFLRVHLLFSSSSPLSPPATCFLLLRLLNLTLQSVCARSWPTDGRTKERSERKKKEEEETNRIRKEECGLKRAGKKKRRRRESSSSSSLYVEGSSSFLSLLPTFRLSLSLSFCCCCLFLGFCYAPGFWLRRAISSASRRRRKRHRENPTRYTLARGSRCSASEPSAPFFKHLSLSSFLVSFAPSIRRQINYQVAVDRSVSVSATGENSYYSFWYLCFNRRLPVDQRKYRGKQRQAHCPVVAATCCSPTTIFRGIPAGSTKRSASARGPKV